MEVGDCRPGRGASREAGWVPRKERQGGHLQAGEGRGGKAEGHSPVWGSRVSKTPRASTVQGPARPTRPGHLSPG